MELISVDLHEGVIQIFGVVEHVLDDDELQQLFGLIGGVGYIEVGGRIYDLDAGLTQELLDVLARSNILPLLSHVDADRDEIVEDVIAVVALSGYLGLVVFLALFVGVVMQPLHDGLVVGDRCHCGLC